MKMFIDESGGLAQDTKYFIVSGIVVNENQKRLNELARDLLEKLIERNARYNDTLKKKGEVKGSDLLPEDKVFAVEYIVKNLKSLGIFCVYISKDQKFKEWLNKDINKRKTVVYLDRRVISSALKINPFISEVFIDKNHYIKGAERYVVDYFKQKGVHVVFKHSHKYGGLQFADVVANAIFVKNEPNKRINEPYEKLRSYILYEERIQWKLIKSFKL